MADDVQHVTKDLVAFSRVVGFGSPIEERLFCALVMVAGPDGLDSRVRTVAGQYVWDPYLDSPPSKLSLVHVELQPEVGGRHPDFLVGVMLGDGRQADVLIECDGHDFHERTKEQARADKSRDRRFAALGHRVLRFTGSEIHADNIRCAQEVYGILLKTLLPDVDVEEMLRRRDNALER